MEKQVSIDGVNLQLSQTQDAKCEWIGQQEILQQLLACWQLLPEGAEAAIIGSIEEARHPQVVMVTELGGERLLDELEDDPLPRIC